MVIVDPVTRLACAARAGDRDALRAFVVATYDDVWRFCASLAGAQDAEDLAQATYVQGIRSLPRFGGQSSARTWLLGIARHVCIDELRGRARRMRRDRFFELPEEPAVADPDGDVTVADLLRRLDPDRRTAFVLTQLIGLSYDEAARACGCPVGTVRSRVARARADLLSLNDAASDRRGPNGTDSSSASSAG